MQHEGSNNAAFMPMTEVDVVSGCMREYGMTSVLLSLGSNVRPRYYLRQAEAALHAFFGEVLFSPVYRTLAVGFDGPDFLNSAAMVHTAMSLSDLHAWLHALEQRYGRDRAVPRFGNRTLDVDVVFYGDLIVKEPGGEYCIPRRELKHSFVLKPLVDVAPDFVDPVSGRTLAQLWAVHPHVDACFQVVDLEVPGDDRDMI
ncbi:2-amino-4-hydroxy-6-hydroxymethyldihydropteridine pyrophosphokinase [Xylella fastidiosa]|nr:2-amino-4-hydroxy-6-hydroxymethyldihydropteridine pyrophosphokinase [Xylella fastidiosa]MCO5545655.1 2-amino-4-hydroxy-6-hydroxymethyldihydropteridine pyrophosphokinase [Xylella fastidiosa]RWA38427.1 2-amino-4-hydroxy-6-hydroxymethyldihydropteridine diphosphokinase [Xylella fastidiosa subsp. multiplex]